MKIVVVNPNTTASMTRAIGETAARVAAAGTDIVAVNPADGPASIEGFYDEAFAVPGLLREIARFERDAPADAYVVACFDDTGLEAARCLARAPVVGIGEAAFHMASLLAARFSVITTLGRSVVALEHNLSKYGLSSRCARVRAAEVPVLSLEQPGSPARARIDAEIARALSEDRAEAIVLGCAGMTSLAASLSTTHGVPVLDGVAAAVKLAEGLAALGLRTSKACSYAPPLAKTFDGVFAGDAPR
ncbi:aspartate/glutamate racemase family protein [Burkholderiaceae bacterium FT117]|uniref:aspartate/glutamate racemase family protein n=1 Tax=Zeimonas sediminis TaxID=2944268 RepID=UPI0023430A29|nr:aspartate/glutamate racemase family protein [Zeimonas sediminis]MCM5570598.1 aspartate/glutamate racemase family protein [Zeimonas sediminis]